ITGAGDEIGWLRAILRIGVLTVKVIAVIVFFMLIRWSWPRFRFDQLMSLAWKIMLPLGMVNLVAVAIMEQLRMSVLDERFGATISAWVMVVPAFAVCVAAWMVVAMLGPRIADNRPRAQLGSPIDAQ